jgi:hypothetical protein
MHTKKGNSGLVMAEFEPLRMITIDTGKTASHEL